MEFQFEKRGEAYFPMYKRENEEWSYVHVDKIKNMLKDITIYLTNKSFPSRWGHSKIVCTKEEKHVYFAHEIYVCAFIGAAKAFWKTEHTPFN